MKNNVKNVGYIHHKYPFLHIMMENTNILLHELSDRQILVELGRFIKTTRLQQNKTQQQIAEIAGVNRSTIVQIENGSGSTMLSFIQVLRALEQLHQFETFQLKPIISPLILAKQELEKRKRAKGKNHLKSKKPPLD
ncbi:helix-turn-helix domain-containing protein [Sediminibacterium sp.]|uniref:helix-turn-helix domain-containing protein n=1 Tax=Sediminibacterium sp. TaxID=1917865 RepID=UPI00272F9E87|nr:helix-turn-helix domain-containing protein [Sediminibacterium sp.]MDP1973385.1 helix-turn-helix domain-containing protein [Sediminibacterium sp.]MDP2420193.1 helix-turn-helix domain-containing protein [Sediminibacterium sp.]